MKQALCTLCIRRPLVLDLFFERNHVLIPAELWDGARLVNAMALQDASVCPKGRDIVEVNAKFRRLGKRRQTLSPTAIELIEC